METWLCLAGGNALGAFHVGAWQAIEASGMRVTRIAGASIGAVVAALIAGSPPDRRDNTLRQFLSHVGQRRSLTGRRAAVAGLLAMGHPTLFVPSWPGIWEILPGMPADRALFRRDRMKHLFEELIDFDRLNSGDIEVTVTALDAETGEVVAFRNTEGPLGIDHLLASTALPVLFRPVRIGERYFLDSGTCENLPLRPLLDRPGDALILALDLYELQKPLTPTMDGVACRAQELVFAGQSARIIQSCDLTDRRFRHVILTDPEDDFAGKAFNYGRERLEHRMRLGRQQTAASLSNLEPRAIPQQEDNR
ncbi:patatin-like phospholipase family protein [Paracoccus benzoatiresistens]|uniref:Patatin-like phospholipase family protein n=1 Tax=Paracoccus benzoatiresistens TaxID=2997341 RepID=A0ABT4J3V3_9RHOB|nr:patatin-like phospholipase family protein [Paracoccus sp. EF6]MCZ0961028.1 patatin-like phospholipase family protein [Paracoccus sp. EF6]